ncbi:unnamed protein product [Allacma fusca]|uniref:Uncharacterized protein n=1 Tax=Allacma fusca TaxID=39272 RepID=A0A8J2LCN4_9HEXA|nr:unnamed protein product [Allacma fusca]
MEWKSSHPRLDFVHLFYPVIFACKCFGILPITNRRQELKFRWCSEQVLYFILASTAMGIFGTITFAVKTETLGINAEGSVVIFEFFNNISGILIPFFVVDIALAILYQTVFYVGLDTARKLPEFLKSLDHILLEVSKFSPREKIESINAEMRTEMKKYLGAFLLAVLTNVGCIVYENLRYQEYFRSHWMLAMGYFTWQFWFVGHVLASILPTLFIKLIRFQFQEIHSHLKTLITAQTEPSPKFSIDYKITEKIPFKSDERKVQEFTEAFGSLKRSYLNCEDLVRFNFIFEGFIFVELLIVMFHLVYACTIYANLALGGFTVFIFLQSSFFLGFVNSAANMTDQVKLCRVFICRDKLYVL